MGIETVHEVRLTTGPEGEEDKAAVGPRRGRGNRILQSPKEGFLDLSRLTKGNPNNVDDMGMLFAGTVTVRWGGAKMRRFDCVLVGRCIKASKVLWCLAVVSGDRPNCSGRTDTGAICPTTRPHYALAGFEGAARHGQGSLAKSGSNVSAATLGHPPAPACPYRTLQQVHLYHTEDKLSIKLSTIPHSRPVLVHFSGSKWGTW